MRNHLLTLAVVAGLAFVAGSAGAVSPLGDIPLTTNVYNAAEVDALLDGAGGGASLGDVTNYVAEAITEYGADDPAAELHKLILADLWRRIDALDGADGSGYVTEAAVEALVAARVVSEIDQTRNTWAKNWIATNAMPIQATTTITTALSSNTSGLSVTLSPTSARVIYSTVANGRTLGIGSFVGAGNNPCLLVLRGFSSVTWPSGARIETAYAYNSNNPNVYAVYKIDGTIYAKKLYP